METFARLSGMPSDSSCWRLRRPAVEAWLGLLALLVMLALLLAAARRLHYGSQHSREPAGIATAGKLNFKTSISMALL